MDPKSPQNDLQHEAKIKEKNAKITFLSVLKCRSALPRRYPWAWGASPQNLFKRVLLNQEMHLEKKLSKNIYFPWRNFILKKQFRLFFKF